MSKNLKVPKLRFKEFSGEWEETKLGEIATKIMYGMNSSAIKYDGKHKYIRITDIDESSRNFLPKPLTSPDGEIEEKFKLKNNDILFTRTGASVGKSYIYKKEDGDLYFAGFLIKFNIDKANSKFVFLYTLKDVYSQWVSIMSVRSGQPGINAEEYKLLKLNLPQKQEQEKIASFLIQVDTKIEHLTKKDKLLNSYKKGVMQNIFSQEIRFSPKGTSSQAQGEADDGSYYSDWEVKKLKDIGKIIGGGTPETIKPEYWKGNIQWFTPTEVKEKYIKFSKRTISELGLKKSSAQLLPKGTLLLSSRATIGDISIALQECTTNQGFQSIVVNSENNNEFIYYWILQNKKEFIRKSSGSTFLEISKTEINKMDIVLPLYKEQTKIANFLSSIDTKIEQNKKVLEKTKEFKKALLQQMFV